MFGFSMVSGMLATLALLLAINLLAHYRSHTPEQRPLLVVDLMAWPVPLKQEKQPQQEAAPKQPPPAPAKTLPIPAPEPAPVAKKVVHEKLETVTPAPVNEAVTEPEEAAEQIPAQPAQPVASESAEHAMPTPVPIFQVTQAPRFLHREAPIYPEVMRAQGISGVVKVEALIDNEGRVRQVSVLKSAGEYFDEAARRAVLSSSFYPAEIEGKPVAVLLRLPVKFGLY